jgi:ABC-type sugar transport system permease subunit
VFFLSFFEWKIIGESHFIGFQNYINLLKDPFFWNALKNTICYTIGVVPTQVILGLVVALILNEKIRGLVLFRLIYFTPVITSWAVVSIVWRWIYTGQYFGLLNYVLISLGIINHPISWLGDPFIAMASVMIVTIWKGIGWAMIIFLAALQAIPRNFYDAAMLDGANRWKRFRSITLPLLRPIIMSVIVLLTIGAVNAFVQIYILTGGGPMYSTETLNMYMYREAFGNLKFGFASAITVITFLLILAISILQIKFLGKKVEY